MGIRISAAICGALCAGAAAAQPLPPTSVAVELPPLSVDAPPRNPVGGPVMPGVVVSQALQALPEIPPAAAPATLPPSTVPALAADAALPRIWAGGEVLLWWPKRQPLIPLVVGNNSPFPPSRNSPGSVVLLGRKSVTDYDVPGGRFTVGASLGGAMNWGAEVSYFFLDTQNHLYTSGPFGRGDYASLGIPFINPRTNAEDFVSLRSGNRDGELHAATSTRVTGWEVLVSADLFTTPGFWMKGLAGYRTFQANEGLLIESRTASQTFDVDFNRIPVRSSTADEVTTSNLFNGAMVGTRTSIVVGALFFDLDSKVSLGGVRQVVTRTGRSDSVTDFPDAPIVTHANGGVFVNPTNAGRFVNTAFAWLPETGMRVGYTFRAARLFFGYNIIYLSDAVRPSDQLDRTVDLAATTTGVPSLTGRPSPAVVRSDFWVQGVSFGLELRY